jgi:hypothetical protein
VEIKVEQNNELRYTKKGGEESARKKRNVYLSSLMMQVPDHVYVLG